MRIEIDDFNQSRHTIDTRDPTLAGQWFVEHARMLMSNNFALGDCRLRIWPTDETETKMIGLQGREIRLTQDALLNLAGDILKVSDEIGARERAGS